MNALTISKQFPLGHQFGQWAGQLGDGRAISIRMSIDPFEPSILVH